MSSKNRKRMQYSTKKMQNTKAVEMHDVALKVPAPVSRRFFAYLLDWYIGGLCTALPISIAASILTGDMTKQYLVDYPASYGLVTAMFALLFACLYYLGVPLFIWRGQTLGKRMCRLRIEMSDGSTVDATHLALREIVGVFILSGVIANASGVIQQMLTIIFQVNLVHPLMYVGFTVTAVSCAMIMLRPDHRCIHDFIGGTEVRLVPKLTQEDVIDSHVSVVSEKNGKTMQQND